MKTLDGRVPVGGVLPLLYAPFIVQGLSNLAGDIAVRDIKNKSGAGDKIKLQKNPQTPSFVSAARRGAGAARSVPCPVFAEPGRAQTQIRRAIPARYALSAEFSPQPLAN